MANKKKSGCLKIIVIPIILLIFCIAVSNGLFDGASTTTSKGEIETQPVNTEMHRLYSQLNADEKKIYDAGIEALNSGKTKFTIDGFNYTTDKETAFKAVTALKDDHPEYFWLNNVTYVSGTLMGDSMSVEMECYDYWKYTTNPEKYTDPVWDKVNEIVAQANTYSTVYEKVVFVHDYLVKNVVYDHDALEDEKLTKNPASAYHIRSAYGCLVTGKAVCAGYAKAFQLIMQQLGIPCYYITGDAGGPHAWNSVELDGSEYLMDVTWDDPDNEKYPKESKYDYFCTTSNLFDKTHEADKEFEFPYCIATDNNYYVKNGYYFTYYSFDAVAAAFNKQILSGMPAVQFASQQALDMALDDLIQKKSWADIQSLSAKSISYIVNKEQLVLTFIK